jgi:hypothetical protein
MPLPLPDTLETLEDMERLKEYLTEAVDTVRGDIDGNSRVGFDVTASMSRGITLQSNLLGLYYDAQMTQQLDEALHSIYDSLNVFFSCYQDNEHPVYNLSTNMIASTAMDVLYDAHEIIEKTGRISLQKTLEYLEETLRLVTLIVGKMQEDIENSRRSRPGFK